MSVSFGGVRAVGYRTLEITREFETRNIKKQCLQDMDNSSNSTEIGEIAQSI